MPVRSRSFDEFVKLNVGDLLRLGYLITWDRSEAEDLVQECLFRVARRWPKVQVMDMPLAYARRVLINLAFDARQRRSRRREELLADIPLTLIDESRSDEFDALIDRSEMRIAIGQLTRQQRTVLGLRYFLDLSEAQVAAILGCSQGNVKSTSSRALARLRELMVSSAHETGVCDHE
jgi:RNA polymerase sigma-70 factor (sigma-E family)